MPAKTAIILAAGKGQKLDPVHTPKHLLRVYDTPIFVRLMKDLNNVGVEHAIVAVGSSRIELERIVEVSEEQMPRVTFCEVDDEADILTTLEKTLNGISEEVIVTSADTVFRKNPFYYLGGTGDIELLVDHCSSKNMFCGAGLKIRQPLLGQPSIVLNDEDGDAWLTGVYRLSKGGVSALQSLLASREEGTHFHHLLTELSQRVSVSVTPLREGVAWFDINTPETLLRAEMMVRAASQSSRPTSVKTEKLKPIATDLSFRHEKKGETNIVIASGILHKISEYTLMSPERTASHHIILTDENVDTLFGNIVEEQFKERGYEIKKLVVPASERAKSIEVYHDVAEKILAYGIDEQSIIFTLGGGVVANLGGFLASTLYRGIGLIHIPTSIMNMIDVSISLKQGINDSRGKNLIGSYYQPLLVLIDPSISIPDWLVRDGISEAIKHALCQDNDFFEYLLNYKGSLQDVSFRKHLIEKTIALKTELMHEDMFEHHRGMALQYGHEVGHTLELLSGFSLTHGQGIAIGMRVSAELSHLMNIASKETVESHKHILTQYRLPYDIPPSISSEAIVDALRFNKKTRGADIRMVLPERVGKLWKIKGEYGIPCPPELIKKAIERSYA